MVVKLSKQQIIGTIGVIIYAGWLLSAVLNPALSLHRSYVSEITVVGQPYFWLFRTFNTIGSVLVLYAVSYIYRLTPSGSMVKRAQKFLVIGSVALFVNAFFTMGCPPSQSLTCSHNFRTLHVTIEQAIHSLSAMTIFLSIIAAQYYYFRLALQVGSRRLVYWHGTHMTIQAISSLLMAYLCVADVAGIGTVQRLSMLGIHIWLLGFIVTWQKPVGHSI